MKISSIIWSTVASISFKGAATAMQMDDMLMGQSLDSFLSGLVQHQQLSEEHKLEIVNMASEGDSDASSSKEHYRDKGFTTAESKDLLRDYLYNTVYDGTMEEETAEEIASTLNLGGLFFTEEMVDSLALMQGLNGAAPADYQGEGNMHRLGNILPVSVSGNSFVNGIWGHATPNGAREYALMCAGAGLSIIDVTKAAAPVRVQFTPLSGGGIWRDVCTHVDDGGKTYAYVAAQGNHGGGNSPNLFVFDLSWLSDDAGQSNGEDSNPIPQGDNGYIDLGETGYGHTINCARGLLFLHTAGSSDGCRVYDISENPTKPKFLFDTGGTGGCHDSMVQTGVDVGGETKDLWIISEGFGRRDNIRDITLVNPKTKSIPPLIGRTPTMAGIYSHSSDLYKNRYLFQTDENNLHDISVYDIKTLQSPMLISKFQHSEHNSFDTYTHNGFVLGHYYFNAYYQAGLRVFDISNPYYVQEVGKIETHRDPDGDGKYEKIKKPLFEGAWNLHVGLPSGNILVNDMFKGLFIVKASAPYDPPESPVVSAERGGNGDVMLSWNSGSNVRGYSVDRSFNDVTYTRIAEHLIGTSFLDSDARGKSAFYRIIAVNGEGEGVSDSVYSKFVTGDTTPPTHAPTPDGTPGNGGPQTATYNKELGVPSCAIGVSCDTLLLLDGRHKLGPEPNQPNTLDNCSDGTGGNYHSDESLDAIFISSDSGEDITEGSTVTVKADAWCWDNGRYDFIYFFHASDATDPDWNLTGRIQCTGGGKQTLSVSYELPKGTLQAVRASIRYENGNAAQGACGSGSYDDADDVVIEVKEDPSFQGTTDTGTTEAEEKVETVKESTNSDQQTHDKKKQHRKGERKRKQQLRKKNGSR